jgi:hypothetical protein
VRACGGGIPAGGGERSDGTRDQVHVPRVLNLGDDHRLQLRQRQHRGKISLCQARANAVDPHRPLRLCRKRGGRRLHAGARCTCVSLGWLCRREEGGAAERTARVAQTLVRAAALRSCGTPSSRSSTMLSAPKEGTLASLRASLPGTARPRPYIRTNAYVQMEVSPAHTNDRAIG